MYRRHKPAPPLSAFVDFLWHYECYDVPHRTERILPSGDLGIVIDLRPQGFEAIMCGACTKFFTLDTARQTFTMGIQFKPGGAAPFLKMPVNELEERTVALRDLWGFEASWMRERLLAASSAGERFRIAEKTLLAQLRPRGPHPAVAYALTEIRRTGNIAELTAKIGISPRRFADVFHSEVGLTPKLFYRVRRFQQALRRLSEGRRVEWAEFALASGYYDQPHFIHDFQEFSGLNPSSYAPRGPAYINHVPLSD